MVQNLGNLSCHKVPLLAIFQGLVEGLAVGDVVLGLAALQELFDLPGAGPGWLAWTCCRRCRGCRCCCWRSRCRRRGTSGEHSGDGAACNMAHSRADSNSASCGCHLGHQAWLSRGCRSHCCCRGWSRGRRVGGSWRGLF